jgi:hypothetical protein
MLGAIPGLMGAAAIVGKPLDTGARALGTVSIVPVTIKGKMPTLTTSPLSKKQRKKVA